MGPARLAWLALPVIAITGCNQPPTAPTVTLSPEAPITTDDLVVEYGGSTDPNPNDTVTYRVSWSRNGTRSDALAGSDNVRFGETAKGDVWKVSVTASDGNDVSPTTDAEVTIGNAPPVATVELSLDNPATDETIRTTVTKKDFDQDPVTITYEWAVNGSVSSNARSDLKPALTSKGQVWEVRVIPNDGEIDGEPAVAEFTIANTVPEITSASIAPSLPDKYDTIRCEGVGWFDLDDDPPGYDRSWRVNGTEVSTDAELVAADLNRGDTVRCELTPNDGDGTGKSKLSTEVVIQNTPPSVAKVVIGPDDPLKGDVVTATITGGTDPDGDDVSYRYKWTVNGADAGTTDVLPSSRFQKGDIIRLIVFPTDGTDEGAEVTSNSVIAGNNLPEIALVELAPAELYTSDILTATVYASDPDGDRIDTVVDWYVDGTRVSETTLELDGGTYFEKGQEIYVTVTPDDGDSEGTPFTTDTVTVLNSVPTAPILTFTPSEPTDGESIQCVIETDSTDADDEDSLTYTFRWQINSVGTTAVTTTDYTGDTLDADTWVEGDDVLCIVTANDGTATSLEGRYGLAYGSEFNPGTSCKDILAERSWYESGNYWIDPDGDGDPSDAFEVICDMDTDGGGWTYAYYVEADYFDGYYAHSNTSSTTAPSAINTEKDIWNPPTEFSFTETLIGCTTQNDANSYYWQYSGTKPYSDWAATSTSTGYVTLSSTSSNTTKSVCYTNYSGYSGGSYGFIVLEESRCGSCSGIQWGAYHYASSTGCNSTSTTYGNHTSKWRSRTITYPVCNKLQTSNGKFWIGLR
jgi:hypothetical protein